MPTIQELISTAKDSLAIEVLLASVLKKDRAYLYSYPEKNISAEDFDVFNKLFKRHQNGEPLAYILGYQEFWSLNLKVTKDTLVPRSDTEILVESALEKLKALPDLDNIKILDLGTGSGAIALALASEVPSAKVIATDISNSALAVAKENAKNLGLSNVKFVRGPWFEPLGDQRFDIILSNPPYIGKDDQCLSVNVKKYEPSLALFSDNDGLNDINVIIKKAKNHLNKNAWILIEHGFDQSAAVADLFKSEEYCSIELRQDLAGNDRMTMAKR